MALTPVSRRRFWPRLWLAAGSLAGPSRPARAQVLRGVPGRLREGQGHRGRPPYLSKGRAEMVEKTPKEDRAKMFGIMKAMDVGTSRC